MLSFRNLAARMVGRARSELERDLHARNYPEATPIPMTDWLAQLDERARARIEASQAAPPPPDVPDDDDDGTDPDDGFWEDFDRRR